MGEYREITQGLKEALSHAKGKQKLRSHTLIVEPIKEYSAAEIKNIRTTLGMAQSVFAVSMGVSKKTVEAWESGRNMPEGPARRILGMIQTDPLILERCNIISR